MEPQSILEVMDIGSASTGEWLALVLTFAVVACWGFWVAIRDEG